MKQALVVLALIAGGCVKSNAQQCGELTCPTGTTCGPTGDRCYDTDLVEACSARADGEACEVPGLPPSVCAAGVCQASRCGDGRVTGSEACDGTDFDGRNCMTLNFYEAEGLRCTESCQYDTSACRGTCGDGIKNGNEKCDGADLGGATCFDAQFYSAPGLACNSTCGYDTTQCGGGHCGDGIINGLEQCDGTMMGSTCAELGYAGALSGMSCTGTCQYASTSCSCSAGRCTPGTQRCECTKFGCGCVAN